MPKMPTEVALAFGDVIQLGSKNPANRTMHWGGIDVVQGGDLLKAVEVFPVINDADGSPFLEAPETKWGTDVRIFGTLTLIEVRRLLLPHAEPAMRVAAILAHTDETVGAKPPRMYQFRPHNETRLYSARFRWIGKI